MTPLAAAGRARWGARKATIGVLTTSYPRDDDDPAGHFVRAHAEWLRDHVGDVEVLACADSPNGGLAHSLTPLRAARITARLWHATRGQAWDAVVAHWLVPCGAVALGLDVPRVAIAHGSDVALLRRLPFGEAFVRALSHRAHLVYVDDALRIDGADGVTQPMPPMQNARVDRALARRALHVDGFVALFVGRLIEDKGCDLLLDALPPNATLLVAGEGPQRLERHFAVTAGRARLFGECRGREKAELFAAADVLVVPSRRDGAPTVIGEAHAANLPVLGTNIGGIPARIGTGGWVVAPTVDALREKLTHLSREPRPSAPIPPVLRWTDAAAKLWPFPVGEPGTLSIRRY